jgi:hypothetical protein
MHDLRGYKDAGYDGKAHPAGKDAIKGLMDDRRSSDSLAAHLLL